MQLLEEPQQPKQDQDIKTQLRNNNIHFTKFKKSENGSISFYIHIYCEKRDKTQIYETAQQVLNKAGLDKVPLYLNLIFANNLAVYGEKNKFTLGVEAGVPLQIKNGKLKPIIDEVAIKEVGKFLNEKMNYNWELGPSSFTLGFEPIQLFNSLPSLFTTFTVPGTDHFNNQQRRNFNGYGLKETKKEIEEQIKQCASREVSSRCRLDNLQGTGTPLFMTVEILPQSISAIYFALQPQNPNESTEATEEKTSEFGKSGR